MEASLIGAQRSFRRQAGSQGDGWHWQVQHTAAFAHPLGAVFFLRPLFERGPLGVRGGNACLLDTGFAPQNGFRTTRLAAYKMILDFSAFSVSLLVYPGGQSGHPLSPAYDDQLGAYVSHEVLQAGRAGPAPPSPAAARAGPGSRRVLGSGPRLFFRAGSARWRRCGFFAILAAMAKKENRIAIAFKSDLKYTELSVLVLGFIRKLLDIADEVFFKIEISLREAANNAIVHGNGRDLDKLVHMEFVWDKSFLRIHVRDENNRQVDLQEVEDKIHNCHLLSFNGRGIMIIRSYMDRFEFHCRPGGSEVVMEKKLP